MSAIRGLSKSAPTEQHIESRYQTPAWLVERIRCVLGAIELDPCTTSANPVGAKRFYAPPDDGILLPWDATRIYVNPPYGRTIRHWTEKALDVQGGVSVILLVPSRTDSRWFQELAQAAEGVLFIRGRIQFAHNDDAPFPSVLVGLNIALTGLSDLGWLAKDGCF